MSHAAVALRAARANRIFRTDKKHPYGKCGSR